MIMVMATMVAMMQNVTNFRNGVAGNQTRFSPGWKTNTSHHPYVALARRCKIPLRRDESLPVFVSVGPVWPRGPGTMLGRSVQGC